MADIKNPSTAESPIEDVFENRHPSESEKKWAEEGDACAGAGEADRRSRLARLPAVNVDEHGPCAILDHLKLSDPSLYTQADLPGDWSYEKISELSRTGAVHARIHAQRLSAAGFFYDASVFRLRLAGGGNQPTLQISSEDHGTGGLSVAFDLPTLMGYDSDHMQSEGEVGKCGVAIDSLEDMGDPVQRQSTWKRITTSMTINSPASILWAMYLVVAEKQGARLEKDQRHHPGMTS